MDVMEKSFPILAKSVNYKNGSPYVVIENPFKEPGYPYQNQNVDLLLKNSVSLTISATNIIAISKLQQELQVTNNLNVIKKPEL